MQRYVWAEMGERISLLSFVAQMVLGGARVYWVGPGLGAWSLSCCYATLCLEPESSTPYKASSLFGKCVCINSGFES